MGEFYAQNMEDAILRQIFEYVAGGNFYIDNSNFAHRFSLCTLKIQYWQLFSYLNSYAMLLEAVSSVKQVPCS